MQPVKEQPVDLNPPTWWQRHRLTILRILGMVLAAAVLLSSSDIVKTAPCWLVFGLGCVLAIPLWQYRIEYLLFRRRLVLSAAARPASRVRAFLWNGGVTRGIQVIVSIFLAWVLLALVSVLSPLHWTVLAVDAVFLSLLAGPVTRQLTGDIKVRHREVIARRWPLLLINGILLSGAMMGIDFFIVGAEDTRHMPWYQLAEQAFTASADESGCMLWGFGSGTLAALEALSWHLSELVIPNLPNVTAKFLAWSFFLLRAVTVAWLYTALLLGISVFLDKREGRRQGRVPESTFSRSFFLTIIILALPFLYAAIKLSGVDPHVVREGVIQVSAAINPCKPDAGSRASLLMKLDKAVTSERRNAINDIDSGIDQGLDRIFADVETGVDAYLDWYFTVIGEYQRLTAVFSADAATAMAEKLEEYLFANLDLETRLDDLDSNVEHMSTMRFARMTPAIKAEIDHAPCDIGSMDLAPLVGLDRDNLRASAAAASGVGAGIVASKVLAKKTAAVVVGKVAAKKSFATGAAVLSKTLAKKGASTALSAGLGLTLCAPAGPVAVLCGVTAGLATWLTVDKALVELDEALNREEMRADILQVLAEQRALLETQFRQKHYTLVDRFAAQMNDALQRTFIPYNDGMGDDGISAH